MIFCVSLALISLVYSFIGVGLCGGLIICFWFIIWICYYVLTSSIYTLLAKDNLFINYYFLYYSYNSYYLMVIDNTIYFSYFYVEISAFYFYLSSLLANIFSCITILIYPNYCQLLISVCFLIFGHLVYGCVGCWWYC